MSRLSELIRDLCPDGVDYRPLGEVVRIRNGHDYKHLDPGEVPVFGSGGIMATVSVPAAFGPSVLIPRKGSLNKLYYVEGPFWTVDTVFYTEIGDLIEPKFLYHYLKTLRLERMNQAGGVPSMTQKMLNRVRTPIPPLEVQQEIVRILDQFTTLEAELEAELKARRKQYEYYRDLLIESCDRTGEGLLGDSSSIFRGASPRPIRSYVTRSGGVPWIKIGDVGSDDKYVTHTAECITSEGAKRSRRVFPGNFILSNSMSFGRPYISKIEGCVHDGWLIVSSFDEAYISDFLYHLLRSSLVQMSFRQRAGRGTVRNLNVDIVAATQVPLVPLEEQKRVLRLLDRFDALVNDISSGLPAEIAARRKQYEHYRDRLLSFPEKGA